MTPIVDTTLKTRASSAQCASCPPDRVCAWACVQGANMEEVAAGAYLMAVGRLNPALPPVAPEIQTVEDEVFEGFNWVGD